MQDQSTTGAVQVFDAIEVVVEVEKESPSNRVFGGLRRKQLLQLGIPEEKVDETLAISSLEEFYALRGAYPDDAYERLEWRQRVLFEGVPAIVGRN